MLPAMRSRGGLRFCTLRNPSGTCNRIAVSLLPTSQGLPDRRLCRYANPSTDFPAWCIPLDERSSCRSVAAAAPLVHLVDNLPKYLLEALCKPHCNARHWYAVVSNCVIRSHCVALEVFKLQPAIARFKILAICDRYAAARQELLTAIACFA